jgi:hypothetical protein
MGNDSTVAGKIKTQITRFSHRISRGLSKPTRRFVAQMIYGIQASKDVKLSNISRSLNEGIALIKTEGRLSRHMGKGDLSAQINQALLAGGALRVSDDTVIALDISDLDKPYARKMENLAWVRDGSTGERRSRGYWLIGAFGADVEGEDLIPLYAELYSQKAMGFLSENAQILDVVDRVTEGTGTRGIWAIDRGGDRGVLLKGMLGRQLKFVIRLEGKRHLITQGGAKKGALKIAWGCSCPHSRQIVIHRDKEVKKKTISVGHVRVQLPFHNEWLGLMVVKGYGEKPLMLLTNVDPEDPLRILEIYLTRWKCEESYRFIKQGYNLEDVRVMSYTALRNTVVLVQAVFYFVSVELGKKVKLNILLKKIFEKAKRFFEIPEFRQYAIADGIYSILFASKSGITPTLAGAENKHQLTLPFAIELS